MIKDHYDNMVEVMKKENKEKNEILEELEQINVKYQYIC